MGSIPKGTPQPRSGGKSSLSASSHYRLVRNGQALYTARHHVAACFGKGRIRRRSWYRSLAGTSQQVSLAVARILCSLYLLCANPERPIYPRLAPASGAASIRAFPFRCLNSPLHDRSLPPSGPTRYRIPSRARTHALTSHSGRIRTRETRCVTMSRLLKTASPSPLPISLPVVPQ